MKDATKANLNALKRNNTDYQAIISHAIEIATLAINMIQTATEYARDYDILPYDDIHGASAMDQETTQIISGGKELDKVVIIRRIDPLQYEGHKSSQT